MDHISFSWLDALLTPGPFLLFTLGGFLVLAATLVIASAFDEPMIALVGVIGGSCLVFVGLSFGPNHGHIELVRAAVSDTYGIELNDEQVAELQYPSAEPNDAYAVYGSTELLEGDSEGIAAKQIHLIWDEGKMKLAEKEGSRYSALPTK